MAQSSSSTLVVYVLVLCLSCFSLIFSWRLDACLVCVFCCGKILALILVEKKVFFFFFQRLQIACTNSSKLHSFTLSLSLSTLRLLYKIIMISSLSV